MSGSADGTVIIWKVPEVGISFALCILEHFISKIPENIFIQIGFSQKYWPKSNVDPLNVPAIENVKKLSKYDRRPEDIKNLSRKTLQIFECPSISPNDAPNSIGSRNITSVKRK